MLVAHFGGESEYRYSPGLEWDDGHFVIDGAGPTTNDHVQQLDGRHELLWVSPETRTWFYRDILQRSEPVEAVPDQSADATTAKKNKTLLILLAVLGALLLCCCGSTSLLSAISKPDTSSKQAVLKARRKPVRVTTAAPSQSAAATAPAPATHVKQERRAAEAAAAAAAAGKAAAAANKKHQQAEFLAFEKTVYATEKPATSAATNFQQVAGSAAKGDATVLDVSQALEDAKSAATDVQQAYGELNVPDDLPQNVQDSLNQVTQDLSTAYMVRSEAYDQMTNYLDDQKVSELQAYKDKNSEADSFIADGVVLMMKAKEQMGLPIK